MSNPTPARERFVGAAGTRLFVREYGVDGPPVVLLHGFPQTGACWHRVATALADRHRVLVPDIPGYGRSERPLGYDARTLTDTVAAFMVAADAPRAAVVGHDWGGMIAYRLALAHPERVERLCVVNSPFRKIDFKRSWHMLFFNLPLVPELAFALAGDRIVDTAHRLGSANPDAFEEENLAEYRAAYRTLERRRSAFAYYRTVTRDMVLARAFASAGRSRGPGGPRARRIQAPTLIVWGMRDPALPPHLIETIVRDIPQARVERIEDAGHFVPDERPERLAALLGDFLKEPTGEPSLPRPSTTRGKRVASKSKQ